MQVDQVLWAEQREFPKVLALGKQGIERLEVPIVRIVVTADDVGFETQAWTERRVRQREADVAGNRPGRDATIGEVTELIEPLEVPSPTRSRRQRGARPACGGVHLRPLD
jgi:hypothetical protein